MKNITYIFIKTLAIGLLLLALGCTKFLDREPISESTVDKISTKEDLEAIIAGAYNVYLDFDAYYEHKYFFLEGLRSGNNYAGGDHADYFDVAYLRIKPESSKLPETWGDPYKIIARANLVLESINQVNDPLLSDAVKNRMRGEAYFLRGQSYYELAKNFGGVPLILKTTTSGMPNDNYLARCSEEETYNQAVSDFTLAESLLPLEHGSAAETRAKPTKGAANAYLARCFAQRPVKDWDKVNTYCDNVINSGVYQLMGNYSELFDGEHYNNIESIFEPQYPTNDASEVIRFFIGKNWRKFFTPSHVIVALFDKVNDARYKSSMYFDVTGGWTDEYWSDANDDAPNDGITKIPYFYKFKTFVTSKTTDRIPFVRLADIMLLKAEALVIKNDLPAAELIVNNVRSRSISGSPVTVTSIVDVLNERRLELFGEGQFWYDLIRHDLADDYRDTLGYRNIITGTIDRYKVEERDKLLPIPLSELDRNPLLTQNPGY